MIYATIRDVNKDRVLAIAEDVKRQYPNAWAKAHRAPNPEGSEFIRLVALALRAAGFNAGVNGKRGNVNDLSQDPVTFPVVSGGVRDGSGTYAQIAIIDLIGSAGGPGAHIAWIDVTDETRTKGDIGAFVLPVVDHVSAPPPGGHTPPPVPPPATTCQFKACACESDIAGAYEALTKLIVLVQSLADRQEQLEATAVKDRDDIKVRIERVSQELANKPDGGKCRLRW